MPAKTANDAALTKAQEIVTKAATSLSQAVAMADRAAVKWPEFRLPTEPGQTGPTFADVAAHLRQLQEPAAPAREKSAPAAAPKVAPRKAAPVKAAPVKAAPVPEPAPVKVVTSTLKLIHDGVNQTSIFGTEKGSAACAALGRNGLKWGFYPAKECWYIRGSQGYAPNADMIGEAVRVLESLTQDGVQLYRVELDVRDTGPDGTALPVKLTAAQAAAWQREYTRRSNKIGFDLRMGSGVCTGCGATGLTETTGRMTKGSDKLPVTECGTCGGFGAPVVAEPAPAAPAIDLSKIFASPLALPAAPVKAAAPAGETAQCPACRTVQGVVNGKFKLHTGKSGNGACRGKVGVVTTDVEPEPVQVKASTRKVSATAAVITDASELAGIKFALQGGLSRTSAGQLATELRSALSTRISKRGAFKGVMFSVFRDKAESKWVRIEITAGAEGFDAAALDAEIDQVARSVRGVKNRMHKG